MTKNLSAALLLSVLGACATAPLDVLAPDSHPVGYKLVIKIRDGKMEEFKTVMAELVAATKQEAGTLVYEWFLAADGKTCHINEYFRDTAAHAAHGEGFAKFAERFMGAVEIVSMNVFGDPEPAARERLAGLNPTFFAAIGGFRR